MRDPPPAKAVLDAKVSYGVGVVCLLIALYTGREIILLGWALRNDKPTPYKVGDILPETAAIHSDVSHTVIVALRSTCPYCTQSLSFYKMLLADRRQQGSNTPRFVAVCLEGEAACRDYLVQNGVDMDEVMTAEAALNLRFLVTPTMILADAKHRVIGIWAGFQVTSEKRSVIRSLLSTTVAPN